MAHSYASLADFEISGLPAKAYSSVLKGTVQKILERASAFADTFLVDRYALPLQCRCGCQCGFDPSLVDVVCAVAAYRVLVLRGFDPTNGSDVVVRQGYDDAIAVLKRVANGQQSFKVCQSTPESMQPDVASNVPRGYGTFAGFGADDIPVVGGMGGGFGT
jgi:phage gp36-like protein